jgi:hypothetical protein
MKIFAELKKNKNTIAHMFGTKNLLFWLPLRFFLEGIMPEVKRKTKIKIISCSLFCKVQRLKKNPWGMSHSSHYVSPSLYQERTKGIS